MSLAEGKIEVSETDFIDAATAMAKWQNFPPSVISHHGQPCCDVAREWILAYDFSQLNAGNPLTGPRWLRQKYNWGPSRWPIYWCEAAEEKTLDCGALAALAHQLFIARGVTSFPLQLIQQYSETAAQHWYKGWSGAEISAHWIEDDLIYHEGCAVRLRDNEIKIWDPTASWWVNPKQFGGYGGVLVLRFFSAQAASEPHSAFSWGKHRLLPNLWQKIERARGDFA